MLSRLQVGIEGPTKIRSAVTGLEHQKSKTQSRKVGGKSPMSFQSNGPSMPRLSKFTERRDQAEWPNHAATGFPKSQCERQQ